MDRRKESPESMAPFPRWADLLPDLLGRIGDRLDLKGYTGARGACTAWRRALLPPWPTLLVVADDTARWCPYVASLATRRSFELAAIVSGSRCVGSSNDGWLALSIVHNHSLTVVVLLHPVAGVEILLPPLMYKSLRWASNVAKVVFAPSPATDDFAAAAICDVDVIAYVTAGATRWAVIGPAVRLTDGDHLADIVYADGGKVYCLTMLGDVHVLRLPERRRRKPAPIVDEAPALSLLNPPPPQPVERFALRPLQWEHQRKLRIMHYEQARARDEDETIPMFYDPNQETFIPSVSVPSESSQEDSSKKSSQEPRHLNAPATVEPLLSEANLPFNRATAFAPPYDIVSSFTGAKNLVFCEGNLYQVWRNKSCTVTLQLPAGGQRRLAANEILVFRYYPRRRPCWDVVKELGGHSLFVGKNNAVSMYAKGVPGLKGNCVYWIGGHGRDQGMVFDMESGRSTPCKAPPPIGFLPRHPHPHSTICWYFLNDTCNEHRQQ